MVYRKDVNVLARWRIGLQVRLTLVTLLNVTGHDHLC